jgi:iron complex transport system permease protein
VSVRTATATLPATDARRPRTIPLLALGGLLLASIAFATAVGAVPIPLTTVLGAVAHQLGLTSGPISWSDAEQTIVMSVRMPRVLGAALVGAALAVSGVLYQGLLRNPLADPFVIGASGGAALAATVALVVLPSLGLVVGFGIVPLCAFGGALIAVALVYQLSRVGSSTPLTTLLLAGFAVSALMTAGMALLMVVSDRLQMRLRSLFALLMGGISVGGWEQLLIVLPLIVIGLAVALLYGRTLNAFALGEEGAAYVGVEVERQKTLIVIVATWLTATAVTISGLVGFVGLVVPHGLRLLVGPDHRLLLPGSALAGAAFLVLMDALARAVIRPAELPLGVLTACIGGPLFLWLLRRARRGYVL